MVPNYPANAQVGTAQNIMPPAAPMMGLYPPAPPSPMMGPDPYRQNPPAWMTMGSNNQPSNAMNPDTNAYTQQPTTQTQQPNFAPSSEGFLGRVIEDLNEIKPNEVPMDGRFALFPAKELDAIYLKAWNSNGVMMTLRYQLDPTFQSTQAVNNGGARQEEMLRRIEALEQTIVAQNASPKTRGKAKEVTPDAAT